MIDHWEIWDLYKALLAMAAGVALGMERELKDKAAGLKTITVICLGSALFAILSYKIGAADGESTRIASYIVSGVGFLGAGVIFKDGLTVTGLTTAGIIWLAAAVGTSIGFGEYYLAATFALSALLVIYASPWINKLLTPRKQTRTLSITIAKENIALKEDILAAIRQQGILIEEKRLEMKNGELVVMMEMVVKVRKMRWLEEYLVRHEQIRSFTV